MERRALLLSDEIHRMSDQLERHFQIAYGGIKHRKDIVLVSNTPDGQSITDKPSKTFQTLNSYGFNHIIPVDLQEGPTRFLEAASQSSIICFEGSKIPLIMNRAKTIPLKQCLEDILHEGCIVIAHGAWIVAFGPTVSIPTVYPLAERAQIKRTYTPGLDIFPFQPYPHFDVRRDLPSINTLIKNNGTGILEVVTVADGQAIELQDDSYKIIGCHQKRTKKKITRPDKESRDVTYLGIWIINSHAEVKAMLLGLKQIEVDLTRFPVAQSYLARVNLLPKRIQQQIQGEVELLNALFEATIHSISTPDNLTNDGIHKLSQSLKRRVARLIPDLDYCPPRLEGVF